MKTTLSILIIGALFAAPACAGSTADACKPDVEKFCPGVKPRGGAVNACLKQHEPDLSSACQQFRQTVKDKIDAFTQACGADIQAHCAGVQLGGRRILLCLRQHQDTLTPGCKDHLATSR